MGFRSHGAARTWSGAIALVVSSLTAAPALAAGEIFEEIFVLRGVERMNGSLVDSEPHFFEVCITGSDVSESTLPTVLTPTSTNHPTGSMQTLTVDGDEFCFSQLYSSVASLLDDFPNGSYTVTATNVAADAIDTKQVTLSSADVGAYSDISAPTSGGTVSTTDPTAVSWSLVDVGGCNTGTPETCLDFFVVFAVGGEEGSSENEVFYERITNPAATGTSIPAGTFEANENYVVEVENRRGGILEETSDTLGFDLTVFKGTADINGVSVTAVPEPAGTTMQAAALAYLIWLRRRRRRCEEGTVRQD